MRRHDREMENRAVNTQDAHGIVHQASRREDDGRFREQVRLTAEAPGRYTLDLTARPQATYLLTLTTASGKTHTVRLLKQSDIFSR